MVGRFDRVHLLVVNYSDVLEPAVPTLVESNFGATKKLFPNENETE